MRTACDNAWSANSRAAEKYPYRFTVEEAEVRGPQVTAEGHPAGDGQVLGLFCPKNT